METIAMQTKEKRDLEKGTIHAKVRLARLAC